jgi:ATP synthase subunit 6
VTTKFITFVTTFLLGFTLITNSSLIYGQEDHHDAPEKKVQGEEVSASPGENHGEEHAAGAQEKEFNVNDHVTDSHEWHILTTKDGHHVSVYLPVILFSRHSGFHVFSSKKLAHGHDYLGFKMGEGTVMKKNRKGEAVEKSMDGTIIEVDENGQMVETGLPLDLSITKNVFMMMLSVIVLLTVFLTLARSYKKSGISEPKGLQGFLEPVVVFIEEDVAIPVIGEGKHARFMPYLLTVFFFILLNNLMGLIPFFPFGANVTGNIAVTMVLAIFTFLITQFSSNRGHWQHVFNAPGVPLWLAPIMIPVEIIGLFTKPFALMVRLFANITAGHIIVLSLISMIFIFKSAFMAIPSGFMVLFMDMIELLVAFLQAYIFTLLSALFIGLAMPEHHHE